MPVIVLGMHRSGTSAITRCINLMGLSLGRDEDLVPADGGNERGYWENASLVRINDEILGAWEATWFAPPRWPDHWYEDPRLAGVRARGVQEIDRAFGKSEWVWKDPRLCLTLPFWRTILPKPPCTVVIWRHPVEVWRSLERAHGLPAYVAMILWTLYARAALRAASDLPTFVTSYDKLLSEGVPLLERLRVFLASHGVQVASRVPDDAVASFLDRGLRHHVHLQRQAALRDDSTGEESALLDYLERLPETHESFDPTGIPPELFTFKREALDTFRRLLFKPAEGLTAAPSRGESRLEPSGSGSPTTTDVRHLQEQLLRVSAQLSTFQQMKSELERCERDLAVAHENAGRLQAWLADAQNRTITLQAELSTIHDSKGWKALTAYRNLKYGSLRTARRLVRVGRKTAKAVYFLAADRREFRLRWRRWRGTRGSPGDPRPEIQAALGMRGRAYADWLARYASPLDERTAQGRAAALRGRSKISILVPVYNTAAEHLRAAIESVRAQCYSHWELCIADDGSTKEHVRRILEDYAARDDRIRLRILDRNLGIVGASNAALSLAAGEFIGLLDHDDMLDPAALLEAAAVLDEHPETDMIYSDEDKLDSDGRRCDPFFKPDWSPTTFLSYMYTCHFGVYRRALVEQVGGFREGTDGSQDYDLVLRLTERTNRIRHIPRVLYHWRMTPQSTAQSASNKNYTEKAAIRALADAMHRRGQMVREIIVGRVPTTYRVRYRIPSGATAHIIVPSRNNFAYLQRCLRSILEKTEYKDYVIHVIDNGSDDPATLEYLRQIQAEQRVRVLRYDRPFNYSAINNWAVRQIDGKFLLLLNDDTEVIAPGWLEAMLEHAQRPEVGAVGAKLLYPDGRVQHAGVILGIGGGAAHAHKYYSSAHPGYFSRLEVVQNFSAVTAACLMTRREVWEQVGGLNETDLAVAFNDVDLCLRIREAGYQIVYTPFAELCHHESVSRGLRLNGDEIAYMQRKWNKLLLQDPFYNPNLTMRREDFSLRP